MTEEHVVFDVTVFPIEGDSEWRGTVSLETAAEIVARLSNPAEISHIAIEQR